jgi:Mor family transcriptional regulator
MRINVENQKQVLEMHKNGVGIKQIARSLKLSRNSVRKILRGSDDAPSNPNVPAWACAVDWQKIVLAAGRGVPLNVLHEENVNPLEVPYLRFWRHFRTLKPTDAVVSMVLHHKPGEKIFFDFCDGIDVVDRKTGEVRSTQLLVGVLAFSSRTFGVFIEDQKQATFIRGIEKILAYFGGVTPYVTIDNLKSGVHKAHIYDPVTNASFVEFANHYGFAVVPARPLHPRDKAKNEAGIGVVQRQFYPRVREKTFASLTDLNKEFYQYCDNLNASVMKDYGVSRNERFETEKSLLLPLPSQAWEPAQWKTAKVHSDCHIQVEKKFYSVPHTYVGRYVKVRIKAKTIEVFSEENESLAVHAKLGNRELYSTHEAHYPEHKVQVARFEIKHAFAEASKVGPETTKLMEGLLSGSHPLRYLRRAQGILRLVQSQKVSASSLEHACKLGLLFNKTQYEFIKSAAEQHEANGQRTLAIVAPRRCLTEVHLHNKE